MLFGALGALAGASRSKKNQSTCSNLKIKILLNNINQSSLIINLLSKEISTNTQEYENVMKTAEELDGTLNYIVKSCKDNSNTETSKTSPQINHEKTPTAQQNSIFDLLREYKKLLDENIITQEEFDKKKKELLKQ